MTVFPARRAVTVRSRHCRPSPRHTPRRAARRPTAVRARWSGPAAAAPSGTPAAWRPPGHGRSTDSTTSGPRGTSSTGRAPTLHRTSSTAGHATSAPGSSPSGPSGVFAVTVADHGRARVLDRRRRRADQRQAPAVRGRGPPGRQAGQQGALRRGRPDRAGDAGAGVRRLRRDQRPRPAEGLPGGHPPGARPAARRRRRAGSAPATAEKLSAVARHPGHLAERARTVRPATTGGTARAKRPLTSRPPAGNVTGDATGPSPGPPSPAPRATGCLGRLRGR